MHVALVLNYKQHHIRSSLFVEPDESLTSHGVASEAAGGADAVQPSPEAAGEPFAPCGQEEINEVFLLGFEVFFGTRALNWRALFLLVSFPTWRSLALTRHHVPVLIICGSFSVLLGQCLG